MMIHSNYKRLFLQVCNWVILALIVLLWLRFALFYGDTGEMETAGIRTQNSVNTGNNVFNDPIAKYHIFGSSQKLYDVPLVSTQSTLNFTLNGIMTGSSVKDGFAYISNNQGVQKSFSVGDSIFDTATLEEVHENWILVKHNGASEKITLTDASDSSSQISGNNRSPKKTLINNKPSSNNYLKHLNGSQQRSWQQMLDQQKFDPNRISAVVGNINLVTDKAGQIQGLRVSNLADGNLLKKHGLESNDIITAINGNKISGNNITTIRQTLQQNPNATITVKRNGKIQNIKVNISEL